MQETRQWPTHGLHVFVLWAFAIAQPLFALLSDGPTFFVAHHCKPLDVCLLVVILCGVLPALIVLAEVLLGLVNRTVRWRVHLGVVALLLTIGLLHVFRRVESVPGIALVAGAIVLGIAGAELYARLGPVRTFFTALAPAVLLFPGLFLFHSPVSRIVLDRGQTPVQQKGATVENPAPVILVILDEFPTTSLMDDKRQIDPIRYPSFAALGREATWFRNATTVHPATTGAIPSMLTGKYPKQPGRPPAPTFREYPDNMFTLLAGTYKLYSSDFCTNLCPPTLNQVSAEFNFWQRIRAIASDVWVIYRHLVVPRDLIREGFPEISDKWANFRGHERRRAWADPPGSFREFISGLKPATEPRLYVVHSRFPHRPFEYLPSGKQYTRHNQSLTAYTNGGRWIRDQQIIAREHQGHLLQVGCTDTLIGEMIEHLKQVGLYDQALIVITADHGVCHRPGEYRREIMASNVEDVALVPLLIKVPYQKEGRISDRNVESVDILPTIAHVLGVEIPWQIDGDNALDPSAPERPHKIIYQCHLASHKEFGEPDGKIVVDAALGKESAALRNKLDLFGSGNDPHGLYRLGPHGELVGRPVASLDLAGIVGAKVELENPASLEDYDPTAAFAPALIRGRLRSNRGLDAPTDLAVAVNGVICGVAEVRQTTNGVGHWSTIVSENSFRPGHNDVRVYAVSQTGGNLTLSRLSNSGVASLASKPRQSATTK